MNDQMKYTFNMQLHNYFTLITQSNVRSCLIVCRFIVSKIFPNLFMKTNVSDIERKNIGHI